MSLDSIEKTAFCPGPVMEYGNLLSHVLFGVIRATQTYQQGLEDRVLKDCKHCVDNYIRWLYCVFRWQVISCGRPSTCLTQTPQCWIHSLRIQVFIWIVIYSYIIWDFNTHLKEWFHWLKTQSVINWPIPKSTKAVRLFLESVKFYCHYVPRFADIVAPTTHHTRNDVTFKWDAEQQTAFRQL